MSGIEAMLTLLGFAIFAGGVILYKDYLNHRREIHGENVRQELSKDDVRKAELMREIAPDTITQMTQFITALGTRMEDGDQLLVQGEPRVDGATARHLLSKPREEVIEDRLDGIYKILDVASGKVRDGYRVTVADTTTHEQLKIRIPEGALPSEQVEALKSGEWSKQPLRMQINIRRLGNCITRATLVKAGLEMPENRR